MQNKIETAFSPALFPLYDTKNSVLVVVDILRATSVITTMFMNGVKEVIPVGTIEEAKEYKARGFYVVAERNGIKLDFADYGNSPYYFTPEAVNDKTFVYSTTNGTHAISIGKQSKTVIIGSYLNFKAVVDYLVKTKSDVLLLCAGWKDKYCTEDSLFCGAIADALLKTDKFYTYCDSTNAARDMWDLAKGDLMAYLEKAAQRHRLKKIGLDDVIPYCHEFNKTDVIPCFVNDRIVLM
ncbi:MAG: 2-phosphosulfolactate phosphatase [Bacteroidota bacterium]